MRKQWEAWPVEGKSKRTAGGKRAHSGSGGRWEAPARVRGVRGIWLMAALCSQALLGTSGAAAAGFGFGSSVVSEPARPSEGTAGGRPEGLGGVVPSTASATRAARTVGAIFSATPGFVETFATVCQRPSGGSVNCVVVSVKERSAVDAFQLLFPKGLVVDSVPVTMLLAGEIRQMGAITIGN